MAANQSNEPKILRIGVIQGGKVIEERLVRKRTTATFGTDAKNTFVFPEAETPKSWPLFEVKGNSYSLVFDEDMEGRVSVDSANVDFSSLKSQNLAQKQGDKYRMQLNDSSRGRVQFGKDLTILFHFVPAPPVAAKPELPLAAKGGWVKSIEPIFTSVLAGSFVVHALVTILVFAVEQPPPPSLEDVLIMIQKITPPKIDTPPPPKVEKKSNEDGKKKDKGKKKKEEKKPAADGDGKKAKKPGKKVSAADRAKANAARRADVRSKIASKGLLAMIGAKGSGGGALDSVFKQGSAIGGDLGKALEGTAGVGVAGGGQVTRRGSGSGGGDGSGAAVGLDEGGLGTGGGGAVKKRGKKKAKIVARVKAADITDVDGSIDKKGVARMIRRRSKAFQACYETALKSNSKLKGKLSIEFVINERGRVSETSVVKDSLGSPQVARCVSAALKRMSFPKPDDGEVAITNVFVFTPGG